MLYKKNINKNLKRIKNNKSLVCKKRIKQKQNAIPDKIPFAPSAMFEAFIKPEIIKNVITKENIQLFKK